MERGLTKAPDAPVEIVQNVSLEFDFEIPFLLFAADKKSPVVWLFEYIKNREQMSTVYIALILNCKAPA